MSRPSLYGLVADHLEEFYPDGDLPPVTEVMSSLGLPRMTAHRHVKTYAAKTGRPIGKVSRNECEHPKADAIEAEIRDGKPLETIRREHSVSLATVKNVVNRRGLAPLVKRRENISGEVYDLILRFHQSTGRPPTNEEIARRAGLRPQTVSHHVATLARLGMVSKDSGRFGISLHGSSFMKDCHLLGAALRDGKGIPEAQRPSVVRLVMPVLAPDRRVTEGRSVAVRTTAAVEHLSARYGRPATAADLSRLARCSRDNAEAVLRSACSQNLLRKERYGYLSTAPDARLVAALALEKVTAQGWDQGAYESLQRVLKIAVR